MAVTSRTKPLILTMLPQGIVPYAELMRLDRPAGFFAFYWHFLIGLAYSGAISTFKPKPTDFIYAALYYAVWTVLLRGCVCTVNDIFDQEYDRQVERTRNRPLARRAVSTSAAAAFACITIHIGHRLMLIFSLVFQFVAATMSMAPMSQFTQKMGMSMTIMLSIYPLIKRISHYPQVFLGFGLALPVAFGPSMWQLDWHNWNKSSVDETTYNSGTICLYLSCVLWTITFDTIYAHQDIKDDRKAGVGSLAVRLGDSTKPALSALSVLQLGLAIACSVLNNFSWVYNLVACGGLGLALFFMLYTVNLNSPQSCAWWFGPGSRYIAVSLTIGLLMETHLPSMIVHV